MYLIKKLLARFDKKNSGMSEKEHWWPTIKIYYWGDPEEEPSTVDSKRTVSLRTLERIVSLRNLNRILSMRPLRSCRNLNYFCSKKTLFGFLIMVHSRVGDEDNFSYENLGFERRCFHNTNHLKIEVKGFFL